MQVDVVVVIVTYNSADTILGLLESLPAACGHLRRDVVVVDNGSTDATASLLEQRTDCRLIRTSNRGYAAGINRGVASAGSSGDILVLNPDTRLDVDSVVRMVEALREPGTGIVAPKVLAPDGTVQWTLRRRPSVLRTLGLTFTRLPALSEYVTAAEAYERPGVADWALGAVLLVSRACSDALGGWDESFFLYSEETDFCLRAADAGFTTRFVPSATCYHVGGASGRSSRTYAMQAVNQVRLYRRRSGPVRGVTFWLLTAMHEVLRVARGDRSARPVLLALVSPAHRPVELGLSHRLVP